MISYLPRPGLLRTLFYPQSRPFIRVEATLGFRLNPSDLEEAYRARPTADMFNTLVNGDSSLTLDVTLHNSGSATAKDLYSLVHASHELNYNPGPELLMRAHRQAQASIQALRPIHPGEIVNLFSASFQQSFRNRTPNPASGEWEIIPHFQTVSLRFLFYAEGSQPQEVAVEFEPEDLDFLTASATKDAVPFL